MPSTSQYLRGVVEHEKILPKLGQEGVGNLVLDSFLSYIYNYTMCTFFLAWLRAAGKEVVLYFVARNTL
jgi:hypothetical protein